MCVCVREREREREREKERESECKQKRLIRKSASNPIIRRAASRLLFKRLVFFVVALSDKRPLIELPNLGSLLEAFSATIRSFHCDCGRISVQLVQLHYILNVRK